MKFNREELDKINIYALRNVAREVGVKSPTSLTKQVLIEEILLIQSGAKQPVVQSKRGRPIKNSIENKKTACRNNRQAVFFINLIRRNPEPS